MSCFNMLNLLKAHTSILKTIITNTPVGFKALFKAKRCLRERKRNILNLFSVIETKIYTN